MKKNERILKTLLALLLVASMTLSATACNQETPDATDGQTQTTTTTAPKQNDEPKTTADLIKSLKNQPEVISLTEYSGEMPIDTVGYELIFKSGELKIAAEIILPVDFKTNGASLLFYYPEISVNTISAVANMFVSKRVGVVRLYGRGYGNSEGMRDMGGEDLADALTLFSLCEKAGMTANRRVYAAGSSEGSITALRMASELGDKLRGVAVIDLISDLEKFCEARGDGVTALTESLVGGTAEEMPDAYQLRSAVFFADKIESSLLLMEYKDNPLFPTEQVDLLEDAVKDAGGNCERYTIEALGSDFVGDAGQKLLSWIASHA